jgi:hypothetical protein
MFDARPTAIPPPNDAADTTDSPAV